MKGQPLTKEEIRRRMQELQNMHKLHEASQVTIKKLRKKVKQQAAVIKAQGEEIKTLKEVVEKLSLQVEEFKTIIFGKRKKTTSGDDTPHPVIPRTKDSYHRALPKDEDVTDTKHHRVSRCDQCHGPLSNKTEVVFFIEDIEIPVKKTVEKDVVEKGYCEKCRRWTTALPMPPTPVQLGENVRMFVGYANIILRLSYQSIQSMLQTMYGLSISDGEISNILEKEGEKLRPEYERMKKRIQQGPAGYDETGWYVQTAGEQRYLWTMTDVQSTETIFLAGRGRGKGNAEELQEGSTHVGITDGFKVYEKIFKHHQLCWAHVLRKFRDMATGSVFKDQTKLVCTRIYERFKLIYHDLKSALQKTWHEAVNKKVRILLMNRLKHLTRKQALDPLPLVKLKAHLHTYLEEYFTCLLFPHVPPDNNKAERSLRHLVIKRKISLGSASDRGAETFSILASVLLSTWWKDKLNFFPNYLELRTL